MADHLVYFEPSASPIRVKTGTLLAEAAQKAGIDIGQPCGGQGRCGRCTVLIKDGTVHRRSTLRLSTEDIKSGYALACQTVVEGDVWVEIPQQEKIERRLTTDRTAAEIQVPAWYDAQSVQGIRRVSIQLTPPSLDDQTDDWSRLQMALRSRLNISEIQISLDLLTRIGEVLRAGEWHVTTVLDRGAWDFPNLPPRLIDIKPGISPDQDPVWGAAIDIGTTTVSVWLVDLQSGEVRAQAAEYNGQISRGEDVISRIIYASKNRGAEHLRQLVLDTINSLLDTLCKRVKTHPSEIIKAVVAGNSTMIHLLLGIPPVPIRLSPFVTTVNHVPMLLGKQVGLAVHPEASVDCLPGVASYVGSDITAGVLASGMDEADIMTLFLDVGTNGEMVLGTRDWLVSCACSAGPAFEGAGVKFGMRATSGAIEEIWINGKTYEPTYRVIGNGRPRGLCGSGLISLLSEMFLTTVIDKGGNLNTHLNTDRIREGDHGWEYVIAWGHDTANAEDIVVTRVDIDNLLRAKAAIYAGFTLLAEKVGTTLDDVEQVLIGGSFGKYINVEKAVQIGLLPDMSWDRFQFLGNTSIKGAYYALLDPARRKKIQDIASKMTYLELSADNTFYDAFMSAMFLPHTDLSKFPSVVEAITERQIEN